MGRKNPIIEIDDAFIEKWHPKYDEFGDDVEEDYKTIIAKISNELSRKGTMLKDTFIDILNWKAPRLKGIVRLNEFDTYEKAFLKCFKAPNDEKLAILDELYGIGVPVASTILHFMYPQSFPIMDIRTAETLYYAGYIRSKARDQKCYIFFQSTILTIAKDHPKWSLRQIDRALFAYHKNHKKYLGLKIKGREGNAKRCS
jgi:thermostable 8-oxoguanine DNA glycosylase